MKEELYQGWANAETACVHRWLSNDEGLNAACRRAALRAMEMAEQSMADAKDVTGDDVEGVCLELLGGALRDMVDVSVPDGPPSLWADLLDCATARVDWQEVAGAFLEGVAVV